MRKSLARQGLARPGAALGADSVQVTKYETTRLCVFFRPGLLLVIYLRDG